MPPVDRADSILSHGERDVAGHLREDPDASIDDIAAARGVSANAIEQSVERVRDKTARALHTLAESPFTAEVARGLDDDVRDRLIQALRDAE